ELMLALAIRTMGVEAVKDVMYFQPSDPKLEMDPAIDASLLTQEIMATFRAFRTPLRFTPEGLLPAYSSRAATARLDSAVPFFEDLRQGIGSKNWVVSGKLTASGYPMMMNDPHRDLSAPSLRYWVHLVAPGWNVIGGGEPALPGGSVGHNESGAWGLTIFPIDQEDLYVYEIDPSDPSRYQYQGGWEAMTTIRESIAVKGRPAVQAELKFTRHGPVLHEDNAHHKAYAL